MRPIIAAAQSASAPGDVRRNAANHLRFGRAAAEHGVKLLVFPELSLTGYELKLARENTVTPDSDALEPLRQLSTRAGMTIVAGAPLPNGRGELYLGALVIRPSGAVSTYTKVHVHHSEQPVFTPGPGGADFVVEGATVALAICRDAKQPHHAAEAAARGADVYAVGAMVDEGDYPQKVVFLKNHAVQHGMAVLLANYSGVTGGLVSAGRSAIWSEDGQVVVECAGTQEALIVGVKENGVWNGAVVAV